MSVVGRTGSEAGGLSLRPLSDPAIIRMENVFLNVLISPEATYVGSCGMFETPDL